MQMTGVQFNFNFITSALFDRLIRRFIVKADDSVLTVVKITKQFHGHCDLVLREKPRPNDLAVTPRRKNNKLYVKN